MFVRNNWRPLLIALAAAPCLAVLHPALAQTAPFSKLAVAINVSQDVNRAEFQSSWDTTPAIDLSASLPFYYGNVRGGVRLIRAHSPELTDINSAFINVGWGPSFPFGSRSSLDMSIAAGSMYMSFTDETVSFRKSESELAIGLRGGVSTRVRGPVHAQIWAEWQHAFTSVPLDFIFVSVGLKYDLVAPDWLRRFLD